MGDFLIILTSGLTVGGMYAVGSIALALVWGALGMLNMAQGALLAIGGYASFAVVEYLGFPWWLGLPAAMVIGLFAGAFVHYVSVRWMYRATAFETNIVIATVGVSIVLQNLLIKGFTAYAKRQPFLIDHGFSIGDQIMRWQTLIIIGVSLIMMTVLVYILNRTRMGRAIRAVSQDRTAASLMGVPVERVFVQVMIIAGVVACASGVLLTSVIPMSPYVGQEPLLKAFIICIIAGLGNIPAAFGMAFALGFFESFIQLFAGARYGFPALLVVVIVVLLWRPYGVFGKRRIVRI